MSLTVFESLDSLLDLPYAAFEKKLTKLEADFAHVALIDIPEETLDEYFLKMRAEYESHTGEKAKIRLAIIGYLSHFDGLVEKYFPEYVVIFQEVFLREDMAELWDVMFVFLTHMDEILRDYTHRLSEPDQYPSYTSFIQELIQNSMIDLLFWLQERESVREKNVGAAERNTDIYIKLSLETQDIMLRSIRQSLELLTEGILEKLLYDLEYPSRVSSSDPSLQLIGRYQRK